MPWSRLSKPKSNRCGSKRRWMLRGALFNMRKLRCRPERSTSSSSSTRKILFSARRTSWSRFNTYTCNRWWIYSPRLAADGNKGDVDEAIFDVPETSAARGFRFGGTAGIYVAYRSQAGRCGGAHRTGTDIGGHGRCNPYRRADLSTGFGHGASLLYRDGDFEGRWRAAESGLHRG